MTPAKPSRAMLANGIRALAIDAVENAQSGHPGMPLGMADIAEVLWNDFLCHNPLNPSFYNRDRFVLSNGHGSMLLYALLHLTGYKVSIDDLQHFRKVHSKTPGHPEYGITSGVETTTGPLGQGLAHAVGMALAEKKLAAEFNRSGFNLIDHFTYAFVGDGCLMEGISHEVCSLAGTWQLGKLIVFWDNNSISIDGPTEKAFTENIPQRFRAYGFHVIKDINGHNPDAIKNAILEAQAVKNKPSLLCCKTIIGFGSPHKAGTAHAHGAPLGAEECKLTKQQLQWPYAPFEIPDFIYQAFDARARGEQQESLWQAQFLAYQKQFPDLATSLLRRLNKQLPENFEKDSKAFKKKLFSENNHVPKSMATRKASQHCIQALNTFIPELLGGSADLTESNLTLTDNARDYIYYGVREFGMSAILCGIALHGGYIPFGGTFLTFSDYARNAIRLAALMQLGVIFIYTHDSIGLGEDGPTHQPIEHLTALRAMPGLDVWRPADLVETGIAWESSLAAPYPSCLVLSRQALPAQKHTALTLKNMARGGYILYETPHFLADSRKIPVLLMATGSEISMAMQAACMLEKQHQQSVRVVSMPCVERFLRQKKTYQDKILPPFIKKRIAIEAGSPDSWYRFTGLEGHVIGLDHFGLSGEGQSVYHALGLTVETVVKTALK